MSVYISACATGCATCNDGSLCLSCSAAYAPPLSQSPPYTCGGKPVVLHFLISNYHAIISLSCHCMFLCFMSVCNYCSLCLSFVFCLYSCVCFAVCFSCNGFYVCCWSTVIVCCTACALNCQSCTAQGPGKCDTCNIGYYLTTSFVCSGQISFLLFHSVVFPVYNRIKDKTHLELIL